MMKKMTASVAHVNYLHVEETSAVSLWSVLWFEAVCLEPRCRQSFHDWSYVVVSAVAVAVERCSRHARSRHGMFLVVYSIRVTVVQRVMMSKSSLVATE